MSPARPPEGAHSLPEGPGCRPEGAPVSLVALQQALARALEGDEPESGTPLLLPNREQAPRLDIYRHAYRARLTEALRSNYPVLHRVLGDEAFRQLALSYLAEHPSQRPSIRWFGDRLPDWSRHHPEALPHPALADLAAMEWALGLSFDAADATPLSFEDLARLPAGDWPDARFAAHPSVTLLHLQWAVEPIWRCLMDDESGSSDEPVAHAHTLLIWRQSLDTRWRSLEPDEADALAACLAGEAFSTLCERAAGIHGDEAPAWVAGALRRWVDDGLLVRP